MSHFLPQKFISDKLVTIYEVCGGVKDVLDSEAHVDKIRRQLIIEWACRVGHGKCNEEAKGLYNDWKAVPAEKP
jgi:hypothetical protein